MQPSRIPAENQKSERELQPATTASRASLTETIRPPSYSLTESKARSPVTTKSALAASAVPMTTSSSGSGARRGTRVGRTKATSSAYKSTIWSTDSSEAAIFLSNLGRERMSVNYASRGALLKNITSPPSQRAGVVLEGHSTIVLT